MKQFKVNLPTKVHEELYRLFPGKGERQGILRKLIVALVTKAKDDESYHNEILEELRG